jgi:hypothetical protein
MRGQPNVVNWRVKLERKITLTKEKKTKRMSIKLKKYTP